MLASDDMAQLGHPSGRGDLAVADGHRVANLQRQQVAVCGFVAESGGVLAMASTDGLRRHSLHALNRKINIRAPIVRVGNNDAAALLEYRRVNIRLDGESHITTINFAKLIDAFWGCYAEVVNFALGLTNVALQ